MAKNISVSIKDMTYSPDPVPVNQGDTVTWTNHDSMPHTATSDAGPNGQPPAGGVFDTGTLSTGQSSAPITFNEAAGPIGYFCTFHTFMTGTVQVAVAEGELAEHRSGSHSRAR
jgi:plastocyanin